MLWCMRTTIRLDDQLLAEAKKLAMQTGRTLTAVIEDALRQALARQCQKPTRRPARLKTVGGKGLQASVDFDSSVSLLELMDAHHDAH